MEPVTIRDSFTNAIRFWEPRRVIYNLALTVVVGVYFVTAYPASKEVLSVDFALGVFLLAVVANVAYCAAYSWTFLFRYQGFASFGSGAGGSYF